jgi:hypothetical protein
MVLLLIHGSLFPYSLFHRTIGDENGALKMMCRRKYETEL